MYVCTCKEIKKPKKIMEGVSTKVYKGLKAYWKRRGYERLTSTGRRRKTTSPSAELGTGNRKRRWRLKISRKLKLRFFSPRKIFTGIRDGYVNMMLRLANSRAVGVSGFGLGGDDCFVTRPVKEYDDKMLVELYKSILMSRGHLVPRDVSRIELKIECTPTSVTLVN